MRHLQGTSFFLLAGGGGGSNPFCNVLLWIRYPGGLGEPNYGGRKHK